MKTKYNISLKNDILNVLPDKPDFNPLNADCFIKLMKKYDVKEFLKNLYNLQDEGKLEINHEAKGIRVFKQLKEMKQKGKI